MNRSVSLYNHCETSIKFADTANKYLALMIDKLACEGTRPKTRRLVLNLNKIFFFILRNNMNLNSLHFPSVDVITTWVT